MAKTLVEVRNPNDPGHIPDHEFSARLVNELYGVNAYAPAAGATVNPDVALGGVHEITLPAGNVTIGPATSSDPAGGIQRYNTGGRVVLVLIQPAAGNATVTWDASWRRTTSGIDPRPNAVTTIEFVNDAAPGLAPQWRPTAVAPTAVESVRVWHTDTANPAVVVQAPVAMASDLTQWRDSSGAVVAAVKLNGGLWVTPPTNPSVVVANAPTLANGFAFLGHVTTAGTWFTDTAANEGVFAANLTTGKRLHVGKSSGTAGLTPLSLSDEAGQVVAIVKGQASQSGSLTSWQNSTGTELLRVAASGDIVQTSGAVLTGPAAWMGAQINASASQSGWSAIVARGFAGQTADLQQWQSSAGTVQARVSSDGSLSTGAGAEANGSQLAAYISSAARAGLVVRAAASQTADLGEWQNSAGVNVARIDPNGTVWAIGGSAFGQAALVGGSATNAGYLAWFGPNGNRLGYMGNNGNATVGDQGLVSLNAGTFLVAATAAGMSPLIVRGAASQTSDLQQWQNSAGTPVSKIDANANAFLNAAYVGATPPPSGAQFSSTAGVATQIPVIARGAASQTADLQKWQSSAGADFLRVTGFGSLYVRANAPQGVDAASDMHINSGGTTDKPLVVRAFAAQTGSLVEWQNSAGSLMTYIDANGYYHGSYQSVQGGGALTLCGDWSGAAASGWNLNQVSGALDVRPNFSSYYGLFIQAQSGQTANLIQLASFATGNVGSDIMHVSPSGNVAGTGAYTTLSDASAKENVRALVHDPLDVIRRLKPRHYDYRDGGPFGGERDQVGFVAQELQAVLPQAVVAFDADRLGTRSEAIVAYLVAAVQELDRRTAAAA